MLSLFPQQDAAGKANRSQKADISNQKRRLAKCIFTNVLLLVGKVAMETCAWVRIYGLRAHLPP